ncbi:unnamed protein product [Protopolystoma xenopodis]|uniref:Uncharacterized protein n=1 Tax=Protopolystoma xenopodis TaxID=117903 RepID=A0A3S5FHC8_9PLAT|nr:unnamed protein product [Protopolystoma xenopodis]
MKLLRVGESFNIDDPEECVARTLSGCRVFLNSDFRPTLWRLFALTHISDGIATDQPERPTHDEVETLCQLSEKNLGHRRNQP